MAAPTATLEGVPEDSPVQSEGVPDSVTSSAGIPGSVPDGDEEEEEEEEEGEAKEVKEEKEKAEIAERKRLKNKRKKEKKKAKKRATDRLVALPEFWTLVAEQSGLAGAWRLTGGCRASRVGAKAWLRTLRRLVLCGGYVTGEDEGYTSAVWRLDLGELRWERMPDLGCKRAGHACCAVRGGVVVLAGELGEALDEEEGEAISQEGALATVEVSRSSDSEADERTFKALPPLSCGPRSCSIALPGDESESAEGQVLLLGGCGENRQPLDEASRVVKVDLATGACTPHPPLLYERWYFAAARVPDGRVVCAGGSHPASITAEVLEPLEQGSPDGAWRWRELPHMSVQRFRPAGCVLSDSRFAVFGGEVGEGVKDTASCEVLTLDGDERWEPLSPMLEARSGLTCTAVGGCVIVAAGYGSTAVVDVYEEALGRWRRLPCNLPHEGGNLYGAGSALM
jgi:hypothetical protein